MNWQSKLEDNDESVYPYGIFKEDQRKKPTVDETAKWRMLAYFDERH